MVSGESCVPAAESGPIASRVKYNEPAIKDDVVSTVLGILCYLIFYCVCTVYSAVRLSVTFPSHSVYRIVLNCVALNCIE